MAVLVASTGPSHHGEVRNAMCRREVGRRRVIGREREREIGGRRVGRGRGIGRHIGDRTVGGRRVVRRGRRVVWRGRLGSRPYGHNREQIITSTFCSPKSIDV